jgi:electron transport complex protein RnfD
MRDVVIALVPAVICSFVFYGWREILLMLVSVASCVCLEWAVTKYMLKQPSTIGDLSAVVTGILLGLNLPYSTPLWVVFIGAVVAICVAKLTFGGIGQNIWNPALVGRVFLLVSFPTYMTTWGAPQGVVDAVSGPTPLGAIQEGLMQGASVQDIMAEHGYSYSSMLFANLGGSAGEVCALALLAGFVYLCVRKVIKPWITLSIFATVAVTALIFWGINPARFTDPLFNLLSGGLILGACFMATDYVTSPMSVWGGVVFGIGIGFLTMMIRYFGSYPEGVSFAILIMNSVVPLLNMWFKQKKFGRK